MGSAAVEHARQFEWDIVVNRWENVFHVLRHREQAVMQMSKPLKVILLDNTFDLASLKDGRETDTMQ